MNYFKGLALALLLFNGVAFAQTPAQQVAPCTTNAPTTNNPLGGCTPVSATNGLYTNLLQGNAALSLTNPLFITPATSAVFPASLASASGVDGWNVTAGAKADSVCGTATGTCTEQALLKYMNTQLAALVSGLLTPPIQVVPTSQYPATAVPITASATGTTAATTATLTNVSGHTTYICGYSVRANATAATTVLDTVTGVITATMSHYLWVAPVASGIGIDEQIFTPCIPASGVSTSIAVVSGAPGTNGLVSVTAWGYSL